MFMRLNSVGKSIRGGQSGATLAREIYASVGLSLEEVDLRGVFWPSAHLHFVWLRRVGGRRDLRLVDVRHFWRLC